MAKVKLKPVSQEKWTEELVERGNSLKLYDTFFKNSQFEKNLSQIVKEKVQEKSPVKIFDIGCGEGQALSELKEKYKDKVSTCGLDLVSPKQGGIDKIIVGDALKNDFPKDCDLIISFRSLHEIGNVKEVLRKICNSLAKGGEAYLSFRAMHFSDGKVDYWGNMKKEDILFLKDVLAQKKVKDISFEGKLFYNILKGKFEGSDEIQEARYLTGLVLKCIKD